MQFKFWYVRYHAYRHKYGRFRAFWRGVVLSKLYMISSSILKDERELMDHLFKVEAVSVEFHPGDAEPPERGSDEH